MSQQDMVGWIKFGYFVATIVFAVLAGIFYDCQLFGTSLAFAASGVACLFVLICSAES